MISIKQATRKEINAKLNELSLSNIIEKSISTTNTLLNQDFFQNSKKVGLYMHLPANELHTNLAIEQCYALKKEVYLPRIEKLDKFGDYKRFDQQKSCLHFLKLDTYKEVSDLKPRGKYQIKEPHYYDDNLNDLLLNKEKLDVLLLPGVAFSKKCKRLGHGAGFYDDFIKRYRTLHDGECPLLVGICLNEQIVENEEKIQLEDHDELLDYVISEDFIFKRE